MIPVHEEDIKKCIIKQKQIKKGVWCNKQMWERKKESL